MFHNQGKELCGAMDCATITQATLYMTAVHASHLISLDWTGLPTAQKTDISRLRQLVLLTGYFYRSLCSHTQVMGRSSQGGQHLPIQAHISTGCLR